MSGRKRYGILMLMLIVFFFQANAQQKKFETDVFLYGASV